MPQRFRIEHYSTLRGGEKVRSVRRGGHVVRIAFPGGRRVRGSGRVLEVLHPVNENLSNPCRLPNPAELVVMMANPETGLRDLSEVEAQQAGRRGLEGATGMCEDFRGTSCDHIDAYTVPEPRSMKSLAQIGTDLVELKVRRDAGWKWGELFMKGHGINVAASPQGSQIYFIGGNQKVSRGQLTGLGVDNSKELIDLGECMYIAYRAMKAHVNGIASDYEHNFGDETGRRPRLMYDRRGATPRLELIGGEYIATIEGIRN